MAEPVSALLFIAILLGVMLWLDYRSLLSTRQEIEEEGSVPEDVQETPLDTQ